MGLEGEAVLEEGVEAPKMPVAAVVAVLLLDLSHSLASDVISFFKYLMFFVHFDWQVNWRMFAIAPCEVCATENGKKAKMDVVCDLCLEFRKCY